MTYIWQQGYGSKYFTVQTNNRKVKRKLDDRSGKNEKATMFGNGVNCSLWLFRLTFSSPAAARGLIDTLSPVDKNTTYLSE